MKKEIKKSITSAEEEEKKFTKDQLQSQSFGGDEYPEIGRTPLEVKVAQLEANFGAIKERMDSERTLKLWIIGTVLAIIAGIIGGFSIYINLIKDSQESYRNLQKDYYQALINLRNDVFEKSLCDVPVMDTKENKK